MLSGGAEVNATVPCARVNSFMSRAECGKMIKLHTQQILSEKVLKPTEVRRRLPVDDDAMSVGSLASINEKLVPVHTL